MALGPACTRFAFPLESNTLVHAAPRTSAGRRQADGETAVLAHGLRLAVLAAVTVDGGDALPVLLGRVGVGADVLVGETLLQPVLLTCFGKMFAKCPQDVQTYRIAPLLCVVSTCSVTALPPLEASNTVNLFGAHRFQWLTHNLKVLIYEVNTSVLEPQKSCNLQTRPFKCPA